MSRNQMSSRKPLEKSPKKINKSTNTTPDLLVCENCLKRQSEPTPEPKNILKDYAKSINYINSCHNIINQMIQEKTPSPYLTMPDLPNFISIFTALTPKPPKPQQELNNIESIDKLCTQINSIDITKNNYEAKPSQSSSEDEKVIENSELVKEPEKKLRNSSIPRPVSSDKTKTPKNLEDVGLNKMSSRTQVSLNVKHRSQTLTAKQKLHEEKRNGNESKGKRKSPGTVMTEEKYSRENGELREEECRVNYENIVEDLNGFVQELSGSETQCSTPRTVSTTSGSPRQRSRTFHTAKITYKTRSEHSLKFSGKSKGKSVGNKNVEKGTKKRSVTICDSKQIVPSENRKTVRKAKSIVKSPGGRDGSPKFEERRKAKSQSMIEDKENSSKAENHLEQTNYDDSDIEPDTQATLDFLRSIQNYPQAVPATPQYVVKQKPMDFFMQRRKPDDDHSESDIEIELNHNQIVSESEVDDDIFIEQNFEEKFIMRGNSPINPRMLPKSILSNIGILTQAGKVKPEKELEMEKLKNSRAQDKQNSSFRQPRVRDTFNDDIVKIAKRNSSSDIRTDDENPIELECITKKYRTYY